MRAAAPQAASAAPGAVTTYAWYVLGLLLVVNVVNYVDRQILAILLPDIRAEFSASDLALGALQPAFHWTYVIAGLVVARLAERGVRRSILAAGLAGWSLMTGLSGFAQNVLQLTLARAGVGAGEAAAQPTAAPIVSDYFPASRRTTAFSVLGIGVHLGILVGFVIGGVVAERFGWRNAFLLVGLPGLALAALVRLTLREPERGAADGIRVSAETPPFAAVVRFVWQTRSLRWLALGAATATLGGAALYHFGPSHVARVSGLERGAIGVSMGLATAIGGLAGTLLAGVVTDWLVRRDGRAYFWTSAFASAAAIPFILGFLFLSEMPRAFVSLGISVFFTSMYLGPIAALPQTLAPPRMRATTIVVMGLLNSAVAQALGSPLVGAVSDLLHPLQGENSLRSALALVVSSAYALSLLFYGFGARHVRGDLAVASARAFA
ncbi:MAG TPA: MFS transporter [Myxococcota bacterium]|nr:MFS transporter [Myxococcota bacterium]